MRIAASIHRARKGKLKPERTGSKLMLMNNGSQTNRVSLVIPIIQWFILLSGFNPRRKLVYFPWIFPFDLAGDIYIKPTYPKSSQTFFHGFFHWRLGFGGQGTHLVAQDAGHLAAETKNHRFCTAKSTVVLATNQLNWWNSTTNPHFLLVELPFSFIFDGRSSIVPWLFRGSRDRAWTPLATLGAML